MSKKHLYVRNERKTPTCETNEKLAHVQKEKKSQKKTPTRAERAKNTFQVVINSCERKQGIKQNNPLRGRRVRAGVSDEVTFKVTYKG